MIISKDTFPDKATERKILSLAIRCPNDGCEWTGELRNKEVKLTYISINVNKQLYQHKLLCVIRMHESHIFVLRKIHFKQMKIIAVYTQLKQLRNKA